MRARVSIAIIAAVSLALLGGVLAAMSDGPSTPQQVADNPCPIDPSGQQVRSPSEYTKAPVYTGPPPHPVQLIAVSLPDATGAREANAIQSAPDLPGDWQADDQSRDAQLVLCQRLAEGTSVGKCPYRSDQGITGTATLTKSTYSYQLYEARTARLLTRFEVAGTGGCPNALTVKAVVPKTLPQGIDHRKVSPAIRSFVETSR
jgi:hypothetical protein